MSPKGKKCKGMEGLIEESSEAMEEYDAGLLDAALIGAAQRVEHYEIAGYGTVIGFAEELGEADHASLLTEILEGSPPHANADDVWFFMQRHFVTLAPAAALERHHIEPQLRRWLAFPFCLAK
jgi:Domain of unknown function (DUF892)